MLQQYVLSMKSTLFKMFVEIIKFNEEHDITCPRITDLRSMNKQKMPKSILAYLVSKRDLFQ